MLDFDNTGVVITSDMVSRFESFVRCYTSFKNEYDLKVVDEKERLIVDYLNKYKLASSEGVNKISNRMIRFEILKKIILGTDSITINHMENVCEQMRKQE